MHHRLRLSPSLKPDRSRGRGVKPIEITTTATFYDYMPGVYFQTTFDNDVLDHRLRAHLRTGIRSDEVLSDSAFGVVTRKIQMDGVAYPNRPNLEGVVNTYPMRSLCAVQDDSSGMALLARGLPEFEAIPEDGQTTLALTLLRAVGWLNRTDLRTRTGALEPTLAVPGAQCQRPISAEYALIPIWSNDPSVLRTAREYSAPLQAYQYSQPPQNTRFTYLHIEGEGVMMTALKPPQAGKGWILRLLNPTDSPIEAKLTPLGTLTRAQVVNLAEETQDNLDIHDGAVWVNLYPHQIVTLRLSF
jgi:alpha-mannosidase